MMFFKQKTILLSLFQIDSWENKEALDKHYESEHYSFFINNFKQYNAHVETF